MIRHLFLLTTALSLLTVRAQQNANNVITHADIRDAILTLVGATREQGGKLERHELRERQLGDALTRSLATLDRRSQGQEKNMDNLAVLLSRMDERLRKMEEMIMQRDERERIQLQKIMDNTAGLKNLFEDRPFPTATSSAPPPIANPAAETEILKQLTRIRKKTESTDEALQSRLAVVANEIKIVGEKFDTRSDRIEKLQLATKEAVSKTQATEAEKLRAASANLVAAEAKWRQFVSDAQGLFNQFAVGVNQVTQQTSKFRNDTAAILVSFENLENAVETMTAAAANQTQNDLGVVVNETLHSMTEMISKVGDSLEAAVKPLLKNIELKVEDSQKQSTKLQDNFSQGLETLEKTVQLSMSNVSDVLNERFSGLNDKIAEGQKLIQAQVEESGNMAESLAERMDKSYERLAAEINGLHKVEQVLLDTADGVLDTKRRLEFAVQQILLELSEGIRRQTGDLNSTLAQKVDDVTLSVLANQTTALTNMTTKLEGELSQVWRQIGVLYQSASLSQELLQRVEQQTATHVGGSLQALSSMDKRVGQVTERVNEVDEHLNYLLGRLSLVVQEFNQVRGGLGAALETLRSGLTAVQGASPPAYTTNGNGDSTNEVTVVTRKENIEDMQDQDQQS